MRAVAWALAWVCLLSGLVRSVEVGRGYPFGQPFTTLIYAAVGVTRTLGWGGQQHYNADIILYNTAFVQNTLFL